MSPRDNGKIIFWALCERVIRGKTRKFKMGNLIMGVIIGMWSNSLIQCHDTVALG